MKKYIKPEVEVNEIQLEGLLANSTFDPKDEINGPMGTPSIKSYTSDDIWNFDYSS